MNTHGAFIAIFISRKIATISFNKRHYFDNSKKNKYTQYKENYESGVSPVSKRYMRAGIGNDGLFVRISTLTYCIPYIFHVHDRIVVCFSNISAYFARNAESLITQESSRKSCSLAGGFVPTRSHRARGGRARRYLVAIEF